MINNRAILKSRRKELRNNSTPAERLLWGVLQHSNLGGCKFRRQHSVGAYILDFYCPVEMLAVELDGDSHFTDDAMEYDRLRTAYLNGLNIKVLRFLNTEVYDNLNGVCERILEELKTGDLTTPSPPKIGGGLKALAQKLPLLDKEGVGGWCSQAGSERF